MLPSWGHGLSYKYDCFMTVGGLPGKHRYTRKTDRRRTLPVVSQVILSSEGLMAYVACVGPFISVGSFMDQKVVRLGEVPATEFTHKFLLGFGW